MHYTQLNVDKEIAINSNVLYGHIRILWMSGTKCTQNDATIVLCSHDWLYQFHFLYILFQYARGHDIWKNTTASSSLRMVSTSHSSLMNTSSECVVFEIDSSGLFPMISSDILRNIPRLNTTDLRRSNIPPYLTRSLPRTNISHISDGVFEKEASSSFHRMGGVLNSTYYERLHSVNNSKPTKATQKPREMRINWKITLPFAFSFLLSWTLIYISKIDLPESKHIIKLDAAKSESGVCPVRNGMLQMLHHDVQIIIPCLQEQQQALISRLAQMVGLNNYTLADPRGAPGTRPPGGPNSFIFMQFLAKI